MFKLFDFASTLQTYCLHAIFLLMLLSLLCQQLSHVGVYQFKVTVKGTKNGAFGFAFVNVTVHPGKV